MLRIIIMYNIYIYIYIYIYILIYVYKEYIVNNAITIKLYTTIDYNKM